MVLGSGILQEHGSSNSNATDPRYRCEPELETVEAVVIISLPFVITSKEPIAYLSVSMELRGFGGMVLAKITSEIGAISELLSNVALLTCRICRRKRVLKQRWRTCCKLRSKVSKERRVIGEYIS